MTIIEIEEPWTVDRTGWGPGPWDDESEDKINWITKAGLDGMAVRNWMGAWCGYVAVDETHPYFGKHYDHVGVSVHGGLTYANECAGHICHVPEPGRPDRVWWLGFDCGHFNDYVPHMEADMRRFREKEKLPSIETCFSDMTQRLVKEINEAETYEELPSWLNKTYKTVGYVRNEVEELAEQLAKIK